MDARRSKLPNMDFITCSKADIEPMLQKIEPSPTFHKITQA